MYEIKCSDRVISRICIRYIQILCREFANNKNQTRMTGCSLQQMSRSLGPGRSHQEHRSPCSTPTVISQQSDGHHGQHRASHGTTSLSHVDPYHWMSGCLAKETPDRHELSSPSNYQFSEAVVAVTMSKEDLLRPTHLSVFLLLIIALITGCLP